MLELILSSMLIGLVATAGMSTFLWIITGFNIAKVDMIKAIGTLYTKNEDNALLPGIIMHFTAGIIFCFCYLILFKFFPIGNNSPLIFIILGSILGIVHGVVVSLLLIIAVAEHHPIESFRKAGVSVAIYHFLAHLIYGFIIWLYYSLLQIGLSIN